MVDLRYSFYEDDNDLTEKARECAGLINDFDEDDRDISQLKTFFLKNDIIIHDTILNLAQRIYFMESND